MLKGKPKTIVEAQSPVDGFSVSACRIFTESAHWANSVSKLPCPENTPHNTTLWCMNLQPLTLMALSYQNHQSYGGRAKWPTSSHLKSFIDSAVPPIRLLLIIFTMPLKRCVQKENYLIALLRNEARNNFFYDSL